MKRRRTQDGVGVQVLIDRAQGATHLSLSRVRVPPGRRTAPAIHQRREEVWCVSQGMGCFHRAAADGAQAAAATLQPGDSVFIPPGYTHWIESIGDKDLVFLRCAAPPDTPRRAAVQVISQGEHFMADRFEYKILVSDADDESDEETLNGLGEQGWELVNAVADVRANEEDGGDDEGDENVPVTVFYFKRPRE